MCSRVLQRIQVVVVGRVRAFTFLPGATLASFKHPPRLVERFPSRATFRRDVLGSRPAALCCSQYFWM